MSFEVGDYVMRRDYPEFVWRVVSVSKREGRLTCEAVCTMEGTPVPSNGPKQTGLMKDFEQAPAMLVIAWESR